MPQVRLMSFYLGKPGAALLARGSFQCVVSGGSFGVFRQVPPKEGATDQKWREFRSAEFQIPVGVEVPVVVDDVALFVGKDGPYVRCPVKLPREITDEAAVEMHAAYLLRGSQPQAAKPAAVPAAAARPVPAAAQPRSAAPAVQR